MKITRVSSYSGIKRTLDIPVTKEQMGKFQEGGHIQDVMPQLTPDQREFILSGISHEEWDEMNKKIEEDTIKENEF